MHFHRGRLLAFVSAHTRLLVACAVAGIAPAAVLTLERSFFLETFGLTGLYLGFGALLLLCLDRTALRGRLGTAFAFVGVNSYSIYLWHLPVKRWVLPKLEAQGVHWPNQVAVYLVGSIVLGVVAAKVVEFPMLALRDRLFPSRSDPEREKRSAA
jgi:peptidoglycan/LPS O-acetylase OafA/YrhL